MHFTAPLQPRPGNQQPGWHRIVHSVVSDKEQKRHRAAALLHPRPSPQRFALRCVGVRVPARGKTREHGRQTCMGQGPPHPSSTLVKASTSAAAAVVSGSGQNDSPHYLSSAPYHLQPTRHTGKPVFALHLEVGAACAVSRVRHSTAPQHSTARLVRTPLRRTKTIKKMAVAGV